MKTLSKLLYNIKTDEILGDQSVQVSAILFDSKKVIDASLFVAIKGSGSDGHDYISNAISNGAHAIVCEFLPIELNPQVTYVQVPNSSYSLGVLASNFYNNPSSQIKLIGVTGTNGKTSIATYLYELFQKLNFRTGLISTIENKINNKFLVSNLTTPDPIEINSLLSLMVQEDCTYCFMEVSSHGIAQNRIAGLSFDIGVFSNITRDHLDYHNSFEEYLNTKKQFFDSLDESAKSIVNIDDQYASSMLTHSKSNKIFYGLNKNTHYNTVILESSLSGLSLEICNARINTMLVGDFNAYNILAVFAVASELGQNKHQVLNLLSTINNVSGRFNIFQSENGITGVIDYAHTPDALLKVIKSISHFCAIERDLIIVVGCGGNRDKGKRSLIGKIAFENSQKAIFTSDNPRFEKPEAIIEDMCIDLPDNLDGKIYKIINREEAINFAVNSASNRSIILVAGKGHEKFQEISGQKKSFCDSQILKKLLKI